MAPSRRSVFAKGRLDYNLHIGLAVLVTFGLSFPARAQSRLHTHKLPKPIQLDRDIRWHRDSATGEIRAATSGTAASTISPEPTIGVVTNLVSVTCTVSTPDGTPVPGLRRDDFQILDNGSEQHISFFDASSQPASVALIVDASPSVLRDSTEMTAAGDALLDALAPLDQVAVIDFAAHTYLQVPFTDVHELARRAIARIDPRELLSDTGGSNVYEAVYLATQKLFAGRTGRKAIVLITDGEDSGLGLSLKSAIAQTVTLTGEMPGESGHHLTFEDVVRALSANDIQLFAVSTEARPKIMTDRWLAAHRTTTLLTAAASDQGIPADTLFLAEVVRRAGGQLYFLRESSDFSAAFRRIGTTVAAQYTIGYYPGRSTASGTSGWHTLGVSVRNQPAAIVSHRGAYFISSTN